MNSSYFISSKLTSGNKKSFARTIQTIAVVSIAMSLATMIISFLILIGFQEKIKDKVFSFGAHLQISPYNFFYSLENSSLNTKDFFTKQEQLPFITHAQAFAYKPALLKTEDEILGIIFKGVDQHFDYQQFQKNMTQGSFISFKNKDDVVISKKIASKLRLHVGDKITMHIFQNPPRYRRLTIRGIYNTGMEDFDNKFIIGNLSLVQKLNNWTEHQANGIELFIQDKDMLEEAKIKTEASVSNKWRVLTVKELYVQIFDWLRILERNVVVFLGLILFVACFNIISILLILIMERTPMIGTLKALGTTNFQLKKIFFYKGLKLTLKGLAIGNLIGIGFGLIQSHFKIIKLDPENYYMSYAPISWDWSIILLLNLTTLVLISLTMLIPITIITRITIIKAIKFD